MAVMMLQNAVTFVILGVLPFNLIKCGINSIGALVLYKRLSPILHGTSGTQAKTAAQKEA